MRGIMKKLLLAGAAFGALVGPAMASDLLPPRDRVPAYAWNGWYAGVNAGIAFTGLDVGTHVNHAAQSNIVIVPDKVNGARASDRESKGWWASAGPVPPCAETDGRVMDVGSRLTDIAR
jgi:hypothetical protein